ncbi:MAG: 3-methyl-2-oxobutanoate hydroxymethyltransferase [Thermomicrobiales bacterium]
MADSDRHAKITAPDVLAMKGERKIVMVTAYDFPTARAAEAAGLEMILVGDSLGMIVLGYDSTVPVTMADMIHHTRAVMRGVEHIHVTSDLPFMSYQVSGAQAVENAGRLMKEAGADSVKLEGGQAVASRIRAIVEAGIPVVGHIGLTPQSVSALGGHKVQGRSLEAARSIIADAEAVEEAGAFAVVLEAVPRKLAEIITARLSIPTIGIGAGMHCDGQVLVNGDLLGLFDRFTPRFAKRYAELSSTMRDAFGAFAAEVRSGAFPEDEHGFAIPSAVLRELEEEFA